MHNRQIIQPARILREDAKPAAMGRLSHALTCGALVFSLGLAALMPSPAKAENNDLAAALLGVLAIGAIAHELDKKHDEKEREKAREAELKEKVWDRDRRPHDKHDRRGEKIPTVCAIEIEGKRNNVALYAEKCLRDRGIEGALPRHCASQAKVFGKKDRVYGEDCLKKAGFRLR